MANVDPGRRAKLLAFAVGSIAVSGCDAILGVTDVPTGDARQDAVVAVRGEGGKGVADVAGHKAGRDGGEDAALDARKGGGPDGARLPDAHHDARFDGSGDAAADSPADVRSTDAHPTDANPADVHATDAHATDAHATDAHPTDAHAGDSGHDASLEVDGGVCNGVSCDGVCTPIVSANVAVGHACLTTLARSGEPSGMAIDMTSVYWAATSTTSSLLKVPLNGGTTTTLASSSSGGPAGPYDYLTTDGTSVYWTTGLSSNPNGTVQSVSVSGGIISQIDSSIFGPGRIVYDQPTNSVIWDVANDTVTQYKRGPKSLVNLPPTTRTPGGLAVVAGELYVGDQGGEIYECLLSACSAYSMLATKPGTPVVLAGVGSSLYAVTQSLGGVYGPVGGTYTELDSATMPTALAVAAGIDMAGPTTFVYWADTGSVLKLDTMSGQVFTLATGQTNVSDMAVDGTNGVYWVDYVGGVGAVMKLSPR